VLVKPRGCGWKQSLQYTGRPSRGSNGTRAGLPHEAQFTVKVFRV
jgi:hypothetical protein